MSVHHLSLRSTTKEQILSLKDDENDYAGNGQRSAQWSPPARGCLLRFVLSGLEHG
jgi:hypothetical protein